jgi:hypothetical protein
MIIKQSISKATTYTLAYAQAYLKDMVVKSALHIQT